MSRRDDEAVASVVLLATLAAIHLVSGIITGFTAQYTVNFWLAFAHRPATFPYWAGFVGGIIPFVGPNIGVLSIVVAALTFVASFFVGA